MSMAEFEISQEKSSSKFDTDGSHNKRSIIYGSNASNKVRKGDDLLRRRNSCNERSEYRINGVTNTIVKIYNSNKGNFYHS